MNIRTLTEATIIQRLAKLGHAEITIDYSTYRGINTKCRFVDVDYGEWWATPGNVLRNGSRHPKRGHAEGGKKFTTPVAKVVERIKAIHGDTLTLDTSTYVNGRTKARFIDRDYGDYWMRVDAVLNPGQKHPMRARAEGRINMRTPVEEIKKRLQKTHGDIVTLDESTYVDTHTNARFIHAVYGPWESNPLNVIKGHSHPMAGIARYKETVKRLYGVDHISQNREIALRMSRGGSRRILVRHWKTGEEITCTASYEYAVVNELNRRQLDFDYQIRFQLSKWVYYCDFYIKDWDVYVETKGFMRPINQLKWDEFKIMYPTAQLWRTKEVKEFTGKTEYRLTKDFKTALLEQNESSSKNDSR